MPSPLRVRDRFRSIFNKKKASKVDLKAKTSGPSQPVAAIATAPKSPPTVIPVISVTRPTDDTLPQVSHQSIETTTARTNDAQDSLKASSGEVPIEPEEVLKASSPDPVDENHKIDTTFDRELIAPNNDGNLKTTIKPEVRTVLSKPDDLALGKASDVVEPSGISEDEASNVTRDIYHSLSIPGAFPDEEPEQPYVPPPSRWQPFTDLHDDDSSTAFNGIAYVPDTVATNYGVVGQGQSQSRGSIDSMADSVSDYDNHSISSSIGDKETSHDQLYDTLYQSSNNSPHTPPKSPDWLDHSGSEDSTPYLESPYAQNYRAMVDQHPEEPVTPTRVSRAPHPIRVRESSDSVLIGMGMPPTPDTPIHIGRKDFRSNIDDTPSRLNYSHPFVDSAHELGDGLDGSITYIDQKPSTTEHTILYNAPIIREVSRPVSREIRTEAVTREIHTYDIYPIIQPITKREYLPTKHYLKTEDGQIHEISKEESKGLPVISRGEEIMKVGNEQRARMYENLMAQVQPGDGRA